MVYGVLWDILGAIGPWTQADAVFDDEVGKTIRFLAIVLCNNLLHKFLLEGNGWNRFRRRKLKLVLWD
ncbi:MAG: hypothetical protein QQW96_13950 [Tychonema bourrellyi B0820]|uniref:Uncharacterized protein n=1 Tax=Tychonema bourrellyi FEM_GT703 TaxID=2040638 RepID=A0A2G4F6G7_9CYAN|nr:hypothetical protein [Tychonema bourrellyi]MDQ2098739.1 hypothetical protein [Tychonema bourrellyi B0820]PHX57348.1 hypothetical protein CP500_000785 [Tychonema bourrellyi FEM_GT703]